MVEQKVGSKIFQRKTLRILCFMVLNSDWLLMKGMVRWIEMFLVLNCITINLLFIETSTIVQAKAQNNYAEYPRMYVLATIILTENWVKRIFHLRVGGQIQPQNILPFIHTLVSSSFNTRLILNTYIIYI